MSAPTADDYRAALALIDDEAHDITVLWNTPGLMAALAVARAAVDRRRARAARKAFEGGPLDLPDDEWRAECRAMANADAAEGATEDALSAAVAALVALAVGGEA